MAKVKGIESMPAREDEDDDDDEWFKLEMRLARGYIPQGRWMFVDRIAYA